MTRFSIHAIALGTLAVAGCSFGPRFEAALPRVRDVPVVANLGPSEALARGRTFLGSRQYGLAIELFKNSARDPDLRTESLNGLAIAYDAIGRQDIAERYFEEALASKPTDARTRRNLERFYAATGQKEKRQAIVAGAAVLERPEPEALPSSDLIATGRNRERIAAASTAISIEPKSPLAPILSPMIVKAGLSARAKSVRAAPAQSDDAGTGIECLIDRSADVGHPSEMRMVRLSVGEVFIAATPTGTTCSIDTGNSGDLSETGPSNGEYLGMVAAYLDRLNRQGAAEEFALLWRAAFWPHRGV